MGCGVTLRFLILLAFVLISEAKSLTRKEDVAYVADPAGNILSKPSIVPQRVGSPISLARPDRYEFYTFDETGELIKRLMTLEEIQDIIATGEGDDGHLLTIAQTDLTKPKPSYSVVQPPSHVKVHTIVNSVQNVLKAEMEAQKANPSKPGMLDTPDVSNSWSSILPAIFGNTGGSITPDTLISSHIEPETDVISDSLDLEKQSEDNVLPTKEIIDEELLDDLVETSTRSEYEELKTELVHKVTSTTVTENNTPTTVKIVSVQTKRPSTTSQTTRPTQKITSTPAPTTKVSSTPVKVSTTSPKPSPTKRQPTISSTTVKLNTPTRVTTNTARPSPTTEKLSTTVRQPVKVTSSTPKTTTTEKVQTKFTTKKESTTTVRPTVIKNNVYEIKNATTQKPYVSASTVSEQNSTPVQNNDVDIKEPNLDLNIGEIISQIAVDLQNPSSTPKYFEEKSSIIVNETSIPLLESPISLSQVIPPALVEDRVNNTYELIKSTSAPIVEKTTEQKIEKTTEEKVETTTLINKSKPTTESVVEETSSFIKILPIVKDTTKAPEKESVEVIETKIEEESQSDEDDDEKSEEVEDYLELVTDEPLEDYTEVTKPHLNELSDSITDLISQINDVSRPPAIPISDLLKVTSERATTAEQIRTTTTTSSPKKEISTETISTTKFQSSPTEKVVQASTTLRIASSTTPRPQTTSESKVVTTIKTSPAASSTVQLKEEPTRSSISTTTPVPQLQEKTTKSSAESSKPDSVVDKTTLLASVTPTTYRPPLSVKTTLVNNPPSTTVEVESPQTTPVVEKTTVAPKTTQVSTTSQVTEKATVATNAPIKLVQEVTAKPVKKPPPAITFTTSTTTEDPYDSDYGITTNDPMADDAELMEMLSQVSQIFKISPKLESKADDLQLEEEEELLQNSKITSYKKSDTIAEDSDKREPEIKSSIKNEEMVLEQLLPKINTVPEKNITIVETEVSERINSTSKPEKITIPNKKVENPVDDAPPKKVESKPPKITPIVNTNKTAYTEVPTVSAASKNKINETKNDKIKSEIVKHDESLQNKQAPIEHFEKVPTIASNVDKKSNVVTEPTTTKPVTQVAEKTPSSTAAPSTTTTEKTTTKITQAPSTTIKYDLISDTKTNSSKDAPIAESVSEKLVASSLENKESTARPETTTERQISSTTEKRQPTVLTVQTTRSPIDLEAKTNPNEIATKPVDEKNKLNDTDDTWKLVSTIVSKNNSKTHVSINTPLHPAQKIQYPDLSDPELHDNNKKQGLELTTAHLGTDVQEFAQLCNELAFRYWDAVASNAPDSKRSLVTSPFAVTSLLSMMFLGARGATSGEMNDILKLDDMVTFNPHIVFKNVTESIEVSKTSGVATSAFVRELFSDRSKGRLISFYKDRVQQFYGGHVEEINFTNVGDVVRRRTNLLVKRQTQGKIPEYIKGNNMVMRPPLSVFAANVFQTDCTSASTEGRDGEMYFAVSPTIRQRRLVPVPAVLYKSGFLAGYVTELDATVAAVGGGDQIVSTILVMPGQQGSTAQGDHILNLQERIVKSAFADRTWSRLLRSLKQRPGLELQIPRFSHRSVENGSLSLQKIGLRDLFSPDDADLRGLNGIANDLYLSDMMLVNTFSTCGESYIGEQHHVEVYPGEPNKSRRLWRTQRPVLQEAPIGDLWEEPRDYQRAFHDPLHDSSLLSMPLHLRPRQARLPENSQEPPRLKFDRPFMFFVRHNPTGLILYMGRYNPRLLP